MEGRVFIFSFLGGVESYIQSLPLQSYQKRGVIFWFWGDIFATIEVGLEEVGLEVELGVILWSFLVILAPILPWILPQSYLKSCWDYGPNWTPLCADELGVQFLERPTCGMGGNIRYVWNVFISYAVCMYVTAPSTVHSMYPQHVGPLQLLSGEDCLVYEVSSEIFVDINIYSCM